METSQIPMLMVLLISYSISAFGYRFWDRRIFITTVTAFKAALFFLCYKLIQFEKGI